jgi:hypothetical protein
LLRGSNIEALNQDENADNKGDGDGEPADGSDGKAGGSEA